MNPVAIAELLAKLTVAFREGDPESNRKPTENVHVGLVQAMYQALASGDFEAALDHLGEDVELEIIAPSASPFVGHWWGRSQVGNALRTNFTKVVEIAPQIQAVVAQGELVAVLARERGRYRDSDRTYDVHWVQLFRFQNHKAIQIREWIMGTV